MGWHSPSKTIANTQSGPEFSQVQATQSWTPPDLNSPNLLLDQSMPRPAGPAGSGAEPGVVLTPMGKAGVPQETVAPAKLSAMVRELPHQRHLPNSPSAQVALVRIFMMWVWSMATIFPWRSSLVMAHQAPVLQQAASLIWIGSARMNWRSQMVRHAGAPAMPFRSQNSAARGSILARILAGPRHIRQCSRQRVPSRIAMHLMILQAHLLVQGRIMRSPSALPCQGNRIRRKSMICSWSLNIWILCFMFIEFSSL